MPDFRVVDETATAQATVRHLLTHTGGWDGDLYLDTVPGDDALETNAYPDSSKPVVKSVILALDFIRDHSLVLIRSYRPMWRLEPHSEAFRAASYGRNSCKATLIAQEGRFFDDLVVKDQDQLLKDLQQAQKV